LRRLLGPVLAAQLGQRKKQIFWKGVGLVVVGLLALIFPVVTSLTVSLMVGWLLIFAGAVTAYGAFSVQGTWPFWSELLLGLLKVAIGIFLVLNPQIGMLALTLLVAAVFVVQGVLQCFFAFDLKPEAGWIWVLLSGLISAVVGVLIAAGLPVTSLYTLGILIGINFVSTGTAWIMLSRMLAPPAAPTV
jgi:uncharacterized membrane protein HdeD (DUF308 family)